MVSVLSNNIISQDSKIYILIYSRYFAKFLFCKFNLVLILFISLLRQFYINLIRKGCWSKLSNFEGIYSLIIQCCATKIIILFISYKIMKAESFLKTLQIQYTIKCYRHSSVMFKHLCHRTFTYCDTIYVLEQILQTKQ